MPNENQEETKPVVPSLGTPAGGAMGLNSYWTENPPEVKWFHQTSKVKPKAQPPADGFQGKYVFDPSSGNWIKDHGPGFPNLIAKGGQSPVSWGTQGINIWKPYTEELMKKDSSSAKKKKAWYEDLEAYPKDQNKSTPVALRYCVVCRGQLGIGSDDDWEYCDPYWVHNSQINEFSQRLCLVAEEKAWMPIVLSGMTSNGIWHSIKWLKSKGLIKLSSYVYHDQWIKPELALKFHSCHTKEAQYGKASDATSFSVCPILKEACYHGDFLSYINKDGEVCAASSEGIETLKDIISCKSCGVLMDKSQGHILQQVSASPICKKCYDKNIEAVVIRGYDDSNFLPGMPDVKHAMYKGKVVHTKDRRMFGVEVELGFCTGSRVENAINVWETVGKDFCYIKHDGSITKKQFDNGYIVKNPMKYGFEIVSAPAGISIHRERWKNLEKCKAFKTFRAWDADSCGFHVHVSRNALTALQIGRILVFMNHINNRYFIEVVAGRGENHYTKFINKKITDLDKKDDTKYLAVRTNKENSIEFRIFRGTVNYRHIIRNIEFCDAVCDFCAPCVASVAQLSDFRHFINFVKDNGSGWPLLVEWLQNMQVIAKKKIPMDNAHFKQLPVEEAVDDRVQTQLNGLMMVIGGKGPIEDILGKCPKPPEEPKKKKKTSQDEIEL